MRGLRWKLIFLSSSWTELGSAGIIRSVTGSETQASSVLTVLPSFSSSLMIPNGSRPHVQTPGSKNAEEQKGQRGVCWPSSVPLSRLPKRQNCFISYFLDQTESCGFLAARVAREPGKHSILFLPQCAQLDIWVLFLLKEGWNRRWGKQLGAPTSQL